MSLNYNSGQLQSISLGPAFRSQAKRQRYLIARQERRRNEASENAQAQRELDSVAHDDDPQPGAFYGLTPPAPDPD